MIDEVTAAEPVVIGELLINLHDTLIKLVPDRTWNRDEAVAADRGNKGVHLDRRRIEAGGRNTIAGECAAERVAKHSTASRPAGAEVSGSLVDRGRVRRQRIALVPD